MGIFMKEYAKLSTSHHQKPLLSVLSVNNNGILHTDKINSYQDEDTCTFGTQRLLNLHVDTFQTGPEVIKLFSCSAQLRLKFILLINGRL